MRVGLIAPPWVPVPPPRYGGTETVVDALARGLQDVGHEVVLVAPGDSGCPVELVPSPERAVGFEAASLVVELAHVVSAYEAVQDCDVVHDHTLAGPLHAARFPRLPVVTTNHGPFTPELTRIYRGSTGRVPLIAISHHQAATVRDLPIARVIHHGIDLDRFPVGSGRGGYLLFLGRMVPEKGAHRAALVARQAGVPLRIAAKMREPAERRYFDAQVRPLLGGGIEYVGEVDGRGRAALLGQAMALVNPIRWPEPFGLVMVEALACGTPVLAFSEGAAPEIVSHGRTGFLCGDARGMVEAVSRLDQLDRSACRRAAEDRFSLRRMVQDHLELYGDVLGGDGLAGVATGTDGFGGGDPGSRRLHPGVARPGHPGEDPTILTAPRFGGRS